MEKKLKFKKNKKGLSAIVITVILIALSMAAIVLVWNFIKNILNDQIGNSESCIGNYDKVQINDRYTCYENLGEGSYQLRFSLMIGDIDVDKVIVLVSSTSSTKSFEITNTAQTIDNLVMFSGETPENVVLPGKNAGYTYNATGFTEVMDSIQIAPIISGTQCETSDSLLEIEECS